MTSFTITPSNLTKIITTTIHAADTDPLFRALAALHFTADTHTITATATDRFRLAQYSNNTEIVTHNPGEILISRHHARVIKDLFGKNAHGPVTVTTDDESHSVTFSGAHAGVNLTVPTINDSFPDPEPLFPKAFQHHVTLNQGVAIKGLRSLKKKSKNQRIHVTVYRSHDSELSGEIVFTCDGHTADPVPCRVHALDTDELSLGDINRHYLAQALDAFPSHHPLSIFVQKKAGRPLLISNHTPAKDSYVQAPEAHGDLGDYDMSGPRPSQWELIMPMRG